MKFAEKLYHQTSEIRKSGYHIESIWMCWSDWNRLQRDFKELEMGEISAEGDMPITKRKWKNTKEHQARDKKERHFEGIKH